MESIFVFIRFSYIYNDEFSNMDLITSVVPIVIIAVIGYILKALRLVKKEFGDSLLYLTFYVSLPALVFNSFIRINLNIEFLYLPVITVILISLMFVFSYFTGKVLHLSRPTWGAFFVGTMILNIGFILPFIIAAYGDEGLARILMLDFMNGFLAFTWVYYIACKHGSKQSKGKLLIRKFLLSPPIWAIVLSIALNLLEIRIPNFITFTFDILGDMTIPLILLALGIYFTPRLIKPIPIISAIIIRMVIGFLIGYAFAEIFQLDGLTRNIVLLGCSAPIGFNVLTFSSLEHLDKEFAASLLSFSILVGIIFIPIFILFIAR